MAGNHTAVYFNILLSSMVLGCTSCVSAFHIKRHQLQLISKPSSIRRIRYYHGVSYNSRISLANSDIDDDANRDDDGEDLAEQFYNQLNKRQQQESDTSNDDQSTIDDDLYTSRR